jgi:hypothetical protein
MIVSANDAQNNASRGSGHARDGAAPFRDPALLVFERSSHPGLRPYALGGVLLHRALELDRICRFNAALP